MKKMLETKELVTVKKKSAGKKIVKVVAFIIVGQIVVKAVSKYVNKINGADSGSKEDGDILKYSVVFSGRNIKVENEPFKGAIITNIFGGIKLDISGAIVIEDVDIHCKNLMGGIEIIVPENVKVNISGKSKWSGCSSHVSAIVDETAPMIHIYTDNFMSGLDVKAKNPSSIVENCQCSDIEQETESEEYMDNQ